MATLRQLEAARRNATKSTGPRTQLGKDIAKQNATKHGLSGAGLCLPSEMAEEINVRLTRWLPFLRPFDDYDSWVAEVATVESVKVDAAQRHLVALLNDQAHRAATCWDADRWLWAERLAERLVRAPRSTTTELRQFKQGAQWMIDRWEGLGDVLDARGPWTEAQRAVALDLLGVPAELRDGPTPLDVPAGEDVAAAHRRLVHEEVEALRLRIAEDLEEQDERDRTRTELGFGEPTREMGLIKRYLSSALRRHEWAMRTINKGGANQRPRIPSYERGPMPEWSPLAMRDDDGGASSLEGRAAAPVVPLSRSMAEPAASLLMSGEEIAAALRQWNAEPKAEPHPPGDAPTAPSAGSDPPPR